VPDLFRRPPNPNSGGLHALGRRFSVGDQATLVLSQLRGLAPDPKDYTVRVTRVDEAQDRVEVNDGEIVWDLMGNHVKVGGALFDPPRQLFPAELFVGKRWRAVFRGSQFANEGRLKAGTTRNVDVSFAIVGRERLSVAAGTFDAFRIEGSGRTGEFSLDETIWLVPYLNFPLRWDRHSYRSPFGHRDYAYAERRELVSARQFAIDRAA
jgi:hypothetical protein